MQPRNMYRKLKGKKDICFKVKRYKSQVILFLRNTEVLNIFTIQKIKRKTRVRTRNPNILPLSTIDDQVVKTLILTPKLSSSVTEEGLDEL